jgi:hypothetical protein
MPRIPLVSVNVRHVFPTGNDLDYVVYCQKNKQAGKQMRQEHASIKAVIEFMISNVRMLGVLPADLKAHERSLTWKDKRDFTVCSYDPAGVSLRGAVP